MTIDTKQALLSYLTSRPALVSVVGLDTYGTPQIYGPPGLPDAWTPRRTIFYVLSGGPSDGFLPRESHNFQFRCYGVDAVEANVVYAALVEELWRKRDLQVLMPDGSTVRLQWANRVDGPRDDEEPMIDDHWPYVISTWDIQFTY